MTVYGQEIACARAEKGTDCVRAYNVAGMCIFEAAKVTDFSGYSLSGGAWSEAEVRTHDAGIETSASCSEAESGCGRGAGDRAGGVPEADGGGKGHRAGAYPAELSGTEQKDRQANACRSFCFSFLFNRLAQKL